MSEATPLNGLLTIEFRRTIRTSYSEFASQLCTGGCVAGAQVNQDVDKDVDVGNRLTITEFGSFNA